MAPVKIGVLALQGAFAEHVAMLRRLDREPGDGKDGCVEASEIRLPAELAELDGLIIPGGESTTIGKLLVDYALLEPLRAAIAGGLPVFGTCAGAIALAKEVDGLARPLLPAMDVSVKRNAFGRQLQSFETELLLPPLGEPPLRAIFIRAPTIERVGEGVEVLARLADGRIVAARQGDLLATAFHPELTADPRLHRYFVRLVRRRRAERAKKRA
jgi:5'-phosphate synthase pdxT subunit